MVTKTSWAVRQNVPRNAKTLKHPPPPETSVILIVMGCYSTQSELARHDSRAHVQKLTIFSTTLACFTRHATRDVNITLASVHRLAKHPEAMSTQKSRYKICDYSQVRSSVPPNIPLMYFFCKS